MKRAGRFSRNAWRPSRASALAHAAMRAASNASSVVGGGPERSSASLCAAIDSGARVRELAGPGEGVVEVAEAVHGAGGVEGGAVVLLGGQQHAAGDRPPQLARHPLDGPVIDDEAEAGRRDAEATGRRRHPQVAADRQLGAGAEGRTVDGGDDRHGQLGEAAQRALQRGGELALLDTGEVGAGAEGRRGARQHHDARRGRHRLGVEEAEQRGVVDGVAALRAIEGDDEHTDRRRRRPSSPSQRHPVPCGRTICDGPT